MPLYVLQSTCKTTLNCITCKFWGAPLFLRGFIHFLKYPPLGDFAVFWESGNCQASQSARGCLLYRQRDVCMFKCCSWVGVLPANVCGARASVLRGVWKCNECFLLSYMIINNVFIDISYLSLEGYTDPDMLCTTFCITH